MKIAIFDKSAIVSDEISLDTFLKYGDVSVYDYCNAEAVREISRDCDIILCNKTPMNELTLEYADKLKYIGLFATGYNNIDLDFVKKQGIIVSNAPNYSTSAVAQHVFALILEIYNKVAGYDVSVKNGDWIRSKAFSYFPMPLYELGGKTIGIIGFGSIGKRVYEIARAFEMKVVIYTRTPDYSYDADFVTLDELISISDIVTIHCPLNEQTRYLINAETLSKMKANSILINTARGPIVDEQVLYNALSNKVIMAAGIDVLETEPMKPDCVLKNAPNIIITPHVAWAGVETRRRLVNLVEENLKAFLSEKPQNLL